jgi:hypothetical protein
MLTADSVLNAIKETLVEQGLNPAVSLEDRDEKTIEWWDTGTHITITVWADDGSVHIGAERDGVTICVIALSSIERLASEYVEVIEAMGITSKAAIAKETFTELFNMLAEAGMTPTACVMEEEGQGILTWFNTFNSRCSVSIWLDDMSASFFCCKGSTEGREIEFADIDSLKASFPELVQMGQVETAMAVMDEFITDYLAPLGITENRLSRFRDDSEFTLYWYDASNHLCNLSIWVPELDASFGSYKAGETLVDLDFDDMASLRASFADLLKTET